MEINVTLSKAKCIYSFFSFKIAHWSKFIPANSLCPHWMSVAQSKQMLSVTMRKDHQALLSSDYQGRLDCVLFLCTAGSQATLNSLFGVRDGNNITSHPPGAWQRTRSPPRLSLFSIRVLYWEAARRSEIYGQCSIRSMSHTHTHEKRHTPSHRFTDASCAAERSKRSKDREKEAGLIQMQTEQMKKGCWSTIGRAKKMSGERLDSDGERGNECSVQVRPSTPEREMRLEVPRKIEIVGHTQISIFLFLFLSW